MHNVPLSRSLVICIYLVHYNITWFGRIGQQTQMMKGLVYHLTQMLQQKVRKKNQKKNMK